MILSTKYHRFIKKSTLIGCLSLSLAASTIFSGIALAGPADDPAAATQSAGPGQTSGAAVPGTPLPSLPLSSNYYNFGITNPVVNPVDKYSYEQMEQDILALAGRYGGHMTFASIGQSLDGRNIYDIVVGNPNAPKKILIQGAIHAREYITVPVMMQQIEYLLAYYDSGTFNDKLLSQMLDTVAIHFIPMANPDGIAISQFGEGAIRSPELRQFIQICYAIDAAEGRTSLSYGEYLVYWKSNARGVDLNHNFNAGWETLNPTLNHNSSHDYKGTAPLSEPEAQALSNLTNMYPFSAVINYHAMGRVIYWDTANNQQAVPSLGMAQAVSVVNGYQVLGSKGVGGVKDWLQQRSNSVPGITIEVGRSTAPVTFSEYPAIWDQNKAVPGIIMDYLLPY